MGFAGQFVLAVGTPMTNVGAPYCIAPPVFDHYLSLFQRVACHGSIFSADGKIIHGLQSNRWGVKKLPSKLD